MMFGRFLFWLIIFYILYKFVFKFVIPVVMASLKVRNTMKNMQDNMKQQNTGDMETSSGNSSTKSNETKPVVPKDDYIDFEEIK